MDSGGFNVATGPPPEQDIPLQIPKKTKLFVEQTQREREQVSDQIRLITQLVTPMSSLLRLPIFTVLSSETFVKCVWKLLVLT